MQATLAQLGEAGLLRQLSFLPTRPWTGAGACLGIGDDAALLPAPGRGARLVACTDLLVEGVDFRRTWASPVDVGHKAAAVNLSDLAAMGARPAGLLLGLGLPRDERAHNVVSLVRAVHRLGRRYGAPLLGGDLSRLPGAVAARPGGRRRRSAWGGPVAPATEAAQDPLVISVTALGWLAGNARPLLRGRARAGDVVVVAGGLGAASAGLFVLEAPPALERRLRQLPAKARALVRARQLRPMPQVALGQLWARLPGIHAVVDVSDGLASDVLHLLHAPTQAAAGRQDLGICLDALALPVPPAVADVVRLGVPPAERRLTAARWALGGGEDFVLAAAVHPRALARVRAASLRAGVTLWPVGKVVRAPAFRRGPKLRVTPAWAAGTAAQGYDHFR